MPQSISIKEAMDTLDGKLVIGGVPKPGNKDDPNPNQPEKPKPKLKLKNPKAFQKHSGALLFYSKSIFGSTFMLSHNAQ